jgi:hypothetical protein
MKQLAALVGRLPETDRLEGVREVLEAARASKSRVPLPFALAELAPHLPVESQQHALEDAAGMDQMSRAFVMGALIPHLAAPLLSRALEVTRTLDKAERRCDSLMALAYRAPEDQRLQLVREALEAAEAIQWVWQRVERLGCLAPHLPTEERQPVFQRALDAASALTPGLDRVEALTRLVDHLPEEYRLEALRLVLCDIRGIEKSNSMSIGKPGDAGAPPLAETLRNARSLADERWRVLYLMELAPRALCRTV